MTVWSPSNYIRKRKKIRILRGKLAFCLKIVVHEITPIIFQFFLSTLCDVHCHLALQLYLHISTNAKSQTLSGTFLMSPFKENKPRPEFWLSAGPPLSWSEVCCLRFPYFCLQPPAACLPGSTGRIICLIHSAVRPLRSGAARKAHAHAASSITTLTSRLSLIQTHISLFVCTKNKYEYLWKYMIHKSKVMMSLCKTGRKLKPRIKPPQRNPSTIKWNKITYTKVST